MDIKELRIGNYVDFLGKIEQVEGISIRLRPDVGYVEIKGISYPQKGFHFKPVELTEEWLIKFRFELEPNSEFVRYWNKGDIKLYDEYHQPKPFFVLAGRSIKYNFQYVHQLQNLYRSLTGEELSLNHS